MAHWKRLLSYIVWLHVAGMVRAAPPVESPTDAQLRAYSGVKQIADSSCANPTLTGWTVEGGVGVKVTLNPGKLVQALGMTGVRVAADGRGQNWSGLLQKDAGAAFASRNTCFTTLFAAMVNRLPVIDRQTGKPVKRPLNPVALFKAIPQTVVATSTHADIVNDGQNQLTVGANSNNNTLTSGPVTTGPGNAIQNVTINPPPVTPDQKQQAHDALIEELRQLCAYPEQNTVERGPTVIQKHFGSGFPHALYAVLTKYYDGTIATVSYGDQLLSYKRQYYQFETSSADVQRTLTEKIGGLTKTTANGAWQTLYEYCVTRALGATSAQIQASSGDLNYSMSYGDAEAVFEKLKADPNARITLDRMRPVFDAIVVASGLILQAYSK